MAIMAKRLTHRIVAPAFVGSIPTGRPITILYHGPLAQLVRAIGSLPIGRSFESCSVHHKLRRNTQVWLKGSVLKTERGVKSRGGSNPSSSSIHIKTWKNKYIPRLGSSVGRAKD